MRRKGKAPGASLVRPWNDTWQVWDRADMGSANWRSEPVEAPIESLAIRVPAVLALPARLVIAAPLWLDSSDDALLPEMAQLDVDVRGLIPRRTGAETLAISKIRVDGPRTLVVACIFPPALPAALMNPAFERFVPSPMALRLPEDACCLWRENDSYVAAFTAGGNVVAWETTDAPAESAAIAAWLERLWLQLSSESINSGRLAFCNYLGDGHAVPTPGFCDREIALERPALGPEPALPPEEIAWKPPHLLEKTTAAARSRQRRQIVTAIITSYVLFLLAVLGWLVWLTVHARSLREVAESASARVEQLQRAARQWTLLGPSIESSMFPIELLHRIVNLMPPEGVRITTFDVRTAKSQVPSAVSEASTAAADLPDSPEGSVRIEGEAQSASAASKFFNDLQGSDELAAVRWQMGPPAILPNNSAKFTILGSFSYEEPHF